MNAALSNQKFYALNKDRHLSEIFVLPERVGTFYVSTHFELANSDLLHFHDQPHLTFILNGGLLDKRQRIEKERFAGELMFFHAGEPHRTITKIFPTKYFTLQFQNRFFERVGSEAKLNAAMKKRAGAKFEMLKIYKELLVNDEFSGDSIEMLLFNLLKNENAEKDFRPDWMNKVVERLNDAWNEEISVSELARAANVHPKTVSRCFPKYFACTLGEYRRKIRIEKSLALIKSSKLTLTEIAHECGFYDQSHFTETFKQLTGLRPKQFRKL